MTDERQAAGPNPGPSSATGPVSIAFLAVTAVFITTLIVSNIVAVKAIPGIGPLPPLPAAIIIFPISYIIGDILTEVYGYSRARLVIWLGFACNLYAVATIVAVGALPGAGWWTNELQDSYQSILGSTPRILAASFVAYLVGEFANSMTLARLKVRTAGRHLWIRTIGSTLVGQGLDSFIFVGLAFGPFWPIALSQWITKSAFEVLATPITYFVVGRLKAHEGIDVYDRETKMNPFSVRGREREIR